MDFLSLSPGWLFRFVSRFALCFDRVCCVSTIARIVQFGNGVDVIPVALVRKRFIYQRRAWRGPRLPASVTSALQSL